MRWGTVSARSCAAEDEGLVDLLLTVAGHLDPCIARNADDGSRPGAWVDGDEVERVGAGAAHVLARTGIGAGDQHEDQVLGHGDVAAEHERRAVRMTVGALEGIALTGNRGRRGGRRSVGGGRTIVGPGSAVVVEPSVAPSTTS